MGRNVEIKAVLRNRQAAELIAQRLGGKGPEIIDQEDIFFACNNARLKLRIFDASRGELIRYKRPDLEGPRISEYTIAHTQDSLALRTILAETLGQIGSVKKRRTLYLIGQTRVHLDDVEGLGDFLEFEVVLHPEQSEAEGETVAREFIRQFGIAPGDLIARPYVDLLPESPIAASKARHYNSARNNID